MTITLTFRSCRSGNARPDPVQFAENTVLDPIRPAPDQGETKRDRVRRLFIDPMTDLGWRKSAKVSAERFKEIQTELCDDLAYLSDEDFAKLRQSLRGKGNGKLHDAWPSKSRIIAWAEMVHPRPIEELPAVMRWFRSNAGKAAQAADRLVAEYGFWCRRKRPPQHDGEFRFIETKAREHRDRLRLIADRTRRGVMNTQQDLQWQSAYWAAFERLTEIVNEGQGT